MRAMVFMDVFEMSNGTSWLVNRIVPDFQDVWRANPEHGLRGDESASGEDGTALRGWGEVHLFRCPLDLLPSKQGRPKC